MKRLLKDQRGMNNVLLIILALVVLAGVGFAAYKVKNKDDSTGTVGVSKSEVKAAEKACNDAYNDKDLCKFMANWSGSQKYRVDYVNTAGGEESKMTMIIDGNNTSMVVAGMETITVDGVTYTKAGNTWYYHKKAEVPAETETTAPVSKDDFDFEAPKEGEDKAALPVYKRVGEEKCGNLTCIKYTFTDQGVEGETSMWIDTKDHLLRKMEMTDSEGSKSTMTFSYDKVSVKVPTPNKELQENQYILPGATEPQTMPTAADYGL